MTEPLFDAPHEPRPLTERQEWIYQLVVDAGAEGLEPAELGALIHERYRKHPAGERCPFCGQDGLRALRESAVAERCAKRGRSTYVALDAPRPAGAQKSELPGESFEDIFGSEAA